MKQVNEGSTASITLGFRTRYGQLQAPLSISYRIDDLASRQRIRAWTVATPAAEAEIVLTPDDNQVVDDAQEVETRVLTFVASYGATPADQVTGEARWAVKNLAFL